MTEPKRNYLRPTSLDTTSTLGFWEGLKQRRFLTTRCTHCGEVFFPPRSHCPRCLGRDLAWVPLSGRGTLLSWTEVHIPGPDFDTPFLMGVVDLDEGLGRVVSRLIEVEESQLRFGLPVKVVYTDVDEGFTIYQFTAAGPD